MPRTALLATLSILTSCAVDHADDQMQRSVLHEVSRDSTEHAISVSDASFIVQCDLSEDDGCYVIDTPDGSPTDALSVTIGWVAGQGLCPVCGSLRCGRGSTYVQCDITPDDPTGQISDAWVYTCRASAVNGIYCYRHCSGGIASNCCAYYGDC